MYLSLCLIVKDENSYIQEWLDYHILQGVEHFWVYDNESTEPLAATLAEYIQQGWVTVHTIKGRGMQLFAYDHCLQTYGGHSKWIGFIDTDEFFVVHDGQSIPGFLKEYEPYGGLAVSSLFFGHGGNRKRPAGGQIAAYRQRAPEEFSYSRLIKSIVQPSAVIFPASPHSFFYRENQFCVNEDLSRVDAQEFPCRVKKIQLNHYFTRSEEEWNRKLNRGRGDSGAPYKDERGTKVNRYANVEDLSILENLRKLISDNPKDDLHWFNLVDPRSTFLTDLMHRAARDRIPSQIRSSEPVMVEPRRELQEYYTEIGQGLRLFEAGKYPEARDFWIMQIGRYPFDPIAYANFAVVCIRMQDYQAAWDALAQAWRIAPKSLYVMMAMVEYFYAVGNYAQAEKTSLLCAALGDLAAEGVAQLALSQWKQGKFQEARLTASPLLKQITRTDVKNPLFKELVSLVSGV